MSTAELDTLLRAAVPPAPERLRTRVAELRPQPRRLPNVPPRRALYVALPVACALAVTAALVHGFSSSPSATPAHWRAATTTTAHGAVHQFAPAPLRSAVGGGADTAVPAVTGRGRLTRYEASLRVRVNGERRLSDATAAATRIARAFGGYAASVEYRTPAGHPGQAFLELRVPTSRVQGAVARLSSLGTILSQRVSTQDLQRDLEREKAQIAQLRQTIRLTLAALRDPAVTPVQRIQLQIKLAAAKRALAQRTHARNATVAEGTLARVSLVLTTAAPVPAAAHHGGRLGRMLGSAVGFLGLEATIALYALVVISPFAVLALLVLGTTVLRRRRDEKRLLARA